MKKMFRNVLVAVLLAIAVNFYAFCDNIGIDELVGEYADATHVQRPQLMKHYIYEKVAVDAVINNVEQWNAFDEATDTSTSYYKVTSEPKTLNSGVPYDISVFYKDKNKVKALGKAQQIKIEGSLLKIIDNRLNYSVWVYGEDLTPADKAALK